jgi:hypothetical protein
MKTPEHIYMYIHIHIYLSKDSEGLPEESRSARNLQNHWTT